ncbi:hypothetical protein KAJ27_13140 [bacterium]|nr:hypothetical protein [bacterium]
MRHLIFTLLFLCFVVSLCADSTFPEVKLVVLTRLKNINIHDELLTLKLKNSEFNLKINKLLLQNRIWSDGTDDGIKDSDPKSATYRLALVENAIRNRYKSLVLLELTKISKSGKYIVSYIRPVNLKLEFKRYFPKTEIHDTIELPLLSAPENYKEFGKRLAAISRNSIKKLIKRNTIEESHKYFIEEIEVNKNDYKSFFDSIEKIPKSEMSVSTGDGQVSEFSAKDKNGNFYSVTEEIRRGGNFYRIYSVTMSVFEK